MAIWSSLSRSMGSVAQMASFLKTPAAAKIAQNAIQARHMGHGPKLFNITPSRFQWHKFKDMLHFYVLLGVIPISAIVFYANVFVGPATLSEIPEGYTPKHWEYHKHPISRWMSRYLYPSPQQQYEKMLHTMHEENERAQLRLLETKIRAKMAERNDYQAYYYRPAIGKYHRVSKEAADYLESIRGD